MTTKKQDSKTATMQQQNVHEQYILLNNYVESIAEHSDSIIEDGTATAACEFLPTLRSPTGRQDSVEGSHDEIEVR